MVDPPPYPGAPLWLRIFGIAAGTLALLLVVLGHVGGAWHRTPSFDSHHHGAVPESGR